MEEKMDWTETLTHDLQHDMMIYLPLVQMTDGLQLMNKKAW